MILRISQLDNKIYRINMNEIIKADNDIPNDEQDRIGRLPV